MLPAHFNSTVHETRRTRLFDALHHTRALIPAGGRSPRNYPHSPYDYRASSHFLYFVGLALPDAWAWFADGQCTLFAPEPGADDAMWIGQPLTHGALHEATGCPVRPLRELADTLAPYVGAKATNGEEAGIGIGTTWANDHGTQERQAQWLKRTASEGITAADTTLREAILSLRLIHDDAAIAGLREASVATTAAHIAGMRATRPGILEARVRASMEFEFTARNMTTAYHSIVSVCGEILHNNAHDHTLADGDLLLADVGAETAQGWAGDVTRDWPVSGVFSSTQRELYEVVLASQQSAIEACQPGTRYRDVHLAASTCLTEGLLTLGILRGDRDTLVAEGIHALFFPHGVGHLLGLDVHDMEDLGDSAGYAKGRTRSEQFGLSYLRLDRDLQPGMAVTVEPGFYQIDAILEDPQRRSAAGDRVNWKRLEAFKDVRGIRIEDDLLILQDGHEVLTRDIPKTVAEVETTVQSQGTS